MENFTPVSALIGGILIGLSAVALMALNGRVAGIAGIVGSAIGSGAGEVGWRLAFVAGLLAGPFLVLATSGGLPAVAVDAPWVGVVAGGFLVGFGSRLGNGCTSGHGVCGLARLSERSLVATLAFVGAAVAVVFVARHAVWGLLP